MRINDDDDDEYEDEESSAVSEEEAAEIAADMNQLTSWVSALLSLDGFVRSGVMAAASARMALNDGKNDIDEEERDMFIGWLERVYCDIDMLRKIMRQETVSAFRFGDYRPLIKKLTEEEKGKIAARTGRDNADDDEDDDDDEEYDAF